VAPDSSVVLNLNPFFVLEESPDPKGKDQLRRAASLCFAAVKIASQLKNESMKPDSVKGNPLCMDQYKVLFGASRQPARHVADEVHVYTESRHVAVLCRNQFYYFPAMWLDTWELAVDEGDILDILKAIHSDANKMDPVQASRSALGVLTSLSRSEWAAARSDLCENELNCSALHVIDSALFVLVLDDFVETDIHVAAANMLHGTNKLVNVEGEDSLYQAGTCMNRWYDKLQIVVCHEGTAGINFEHSAIDGHTALRFVSDCYAETVISFADSIVDLIHGRGSIPHVVDAVIQRAATTKDEHGRPILDVLPKKLMFELPESVKQRIFYAETALCDDIITSDTHVLEFHEYGKNLIVGNKMSPDSFVQMSTMLAYYKLYGKVVCTYEPVLTKTFYHGRTEAMRSATPQAAQLCAMWCRKDATAAIKLQALRKATTEHSRLVKEAAAGKGVDRHLFALKSLAQRQNIQLPKFFESEAWTTLNYTILSTSNCGNPSLRLFGFGPVVADGFGIGYIIKENGLHYSVSSKHRQTSRYVQTLRATLLEMKDILKPISSVEVGHHRPSLSGVKVLPSRQSSMEYGDLYGETDMIQQLKTAASMSVPLHVSPKRRASRFFSQVVPQSGSLTFRTRNMLADFYLDGDSDTKVKDDAKIGNLSELFNANGKK
jgi:carnitine O-acetyltransferase